MQDAHEPSIPREILIRADAIDFIYQRNIAISLLLFSAALAFAAEAMLVMPRITIFGWLGTMLALLLVRERLLGRYGRIRPPPAKAPAWARLYSAVAFVIGLAWGCGSLLFYAPEYPSHMVFLLVFIMAHGLVTLPLLAYWKASYYAYVFPTSLPILFPLLASGEFGWTTLGVLGLVLLGLAVYLVRRLHAFLLENIALRYENIDLLDHLKAEKERAENAYRANSRFLAAASHDLRQPLHALTLYLEPLASELRDGRYAGLAEKARASANGLADLLNAILDISRLDAETLKPALQPVSVRVLCEQLATELAPQFGAKGLRFRFRFVDAWVMTDPVFASRLLRNLLVNALRFTERGGVILGARRQGGGDVSVEVWDTGIGIPGEALDEIFDEYIQLNNPEREREKGLGLGLAIVRRLTRLLGLGMTVSSRVDRGSVFRVRFPGTEPPAPAAKGAVMRPVGSVEGMRVLVIDDSREALDAAARLLESWGCEVLTAAALPEALERLSRWDGVPQAIIADYRLPEEKTGLDAIAAVRKHYATDIPALLITGDTSGDEWGKIGVSGIPAMHKPLSPSRLRAYLGRIRGLALPGSHNVMS